MMVMHVVDAADHEAWRLPDGGEDCQIGVQQWLAGALRHRAYAVTVPDGDR
jgi:hypothetical protein